MCGGINQETKVSRVVSKNEMERRKAMARAKERLTNAMIGGDPGGGLTAMEWVNVLHEMAERMIAMGLHEEWSDESK